MRGTPCRGAGLGKAGRPRPGTPGVPGQGTRLRQHRRPRPAALGVPGQGTRLRQHRRPRPATRRLSRRRPGTMRCRCRTVWPSGRARDNGELGSRRPAGGTRRGSGLPARRLRRGSPGRCLPGRCLAGRCLAGRCLPRCQLASRSLARGQHGPRGRARGGVGGHDPGRRRAPAPCGQRPCGGRGSARSVCSYRGLSSRNYCGRSSRRPEDRPDGRRHRLGGRRGAIP